MTDERFMSFFDSRPRLFQLLFGILTTLLVVACGLNLHHLTISPTDENLFVDPVSLVSVAETGVPDLLPGDQIVEMQGRKVRTLKDVQAIVDTLSAAMSKVEVIRPETNKRLTFTIQTSSLRKVELAALPSHVRVVGVAPGGASDRAGMKIGDLITRINGATFATALQADSVLRSGATGKNFVYSIIRQNQPMDINVVLASIGIALFVVGYALTSLVFLALGVLIVRKKPEQKGARLLALSCLLLFAGPLLTPYGLTKNVQWWYFFAPASFVCYAFGAALLAHAFHYFPATRTVMLKKRWPLIIMYGLIPLFFPFVIEPGVPPGPVVILTQGSMMLLLFLFFRKHTTPESRRLLLPFKAAIVFLVVMFFVAAVFLDQSGQTVMAFFFPLLPLSLLYTIGRHRFFDLNLRVRKNIQFSFASTAWTIALIVLFVYSMMRLPRQELQLPNVQLTGTAIEVLSTPLKDDERTIAEKTFLMLVAVGLAIGLIKVGRVGYAFLAGKFYRGAYDYRKAAQEISAVLSSTLNMEDLGRGIAQKLSEMMRLKRVGVLFFRNQSTCCCREAHGFDGESWSAFCVLNDKEILDVLQTRAQEMPVHSLPRQLRDEFLARDLHILVPIRSKEKLIGALLIGEKLSETTFGREDYEFLAATARQASVAVENSFLYEELAEQERLKHELAIARRIQLESLPQTTPVVEGLDVAGSSIPAFEVGGDYFDYLNGEASNLTVIIGDVSGKGTSAALYMSKVQGILRSLHGFGLSPRELFIGANRLLRGDMASNSYVTALAAKFDNTKKIVRLARAGHLPLYHFDAGSETVKRILPQGLGIGISEDTTFTERLEEITLRYSRGDLFLFVTDGITEGRREDNDEFGEIKLEEILTTCAHCSAMEIRDRVLASVKEFAGGREQHDDQTVVVVKIQ